VTCFPARHAPQQAYEFPLLFPGVCLAPCLFYVCIMFSCFAFASAGLSYHFVSRSGHVLLLLRLRLSYGDVVGRRSLGVLYKRQSIRDE
jgi:hypothetical protein